MNVIKIFYFIFLIHKALSILNKINATHEPNYYCDNNLFFIDLKVDFAMPIDNYYSFSLDLEYPPDVKFKCFIEYQNKTIHCSANLNSNMFNFEMSQLFQLPNQFPKMKGFLWDYDSFVKNVYGKYYLLDYNCLQKNLENPLNKKDDNEYALIFNITSIYDNRCSYSRNVEENKYFFNMKLNILDGFLKKEIEKSSNRDGDISSLEVEFLQEIWVPILFGRNINHLDQLKKSFYYPFAFCSMKDKISNLNLNALMKEEGINFECYIPIPEDQLMMGIIQIKPFYDQIYLRLNKDQVNEIVLTKMYFNINITKEQTDNENKQQMRRNDEITDISSEIINTILSKNTTENNDNNESPKEIIKTYISPMTTTISQIENKNINITKEKTYETINYLLIGNETDKVHCPDKPIFSINKLNDIQLKYSQEKNYSFLLKGKLSFDFLKGSNILLNKTNEEIDFYLQVTDNLAENEDDQRTMVHCIIPNNTNFFNKSISINCDGKKISEESMKKNNTDITLNWGIEKNRIHEKIIIKWPKTKKRIKHMYSYTIKAFSLIQKNYGCFNEEFYFYIYIYNLDYEPNIYFEIEMKNPKIPRAVCKVYESSILKCFLPLHRQRLLKNTKISLPTNVTYEIRDSRGNKVIFIVDEYDYDYDDFHIKVRETCGDYILIGALKRAGFSYFMIIMGIIGLAVFIFLFLVLFSCFVAYKIKHRNRKGQYFAHIEEGDNSGIKTIKGKKMNIGSSIRK